jgi:hypothetical protein
MKLPPAFDEGLAGENHDMPSISKSKMTSLGFAGIDAAERSSRR